MALLGFDGFDHYNSIDDMEQRSSSIQYQRPLGGIINALFVTGRNGFGKAFSFESTSAGNNHGLYCSYGGNRNSNNFFGLAVYLGTNIGMNFAFYDTTMNEVQCTVAFNPLSYSIQLYHGFFVPGASIPLTPIGTSPNNVWYGGTWNYFEIWPTISNGAGGVKVYFNNNLVCDITGVDTQESAFAWWDMWELYPTDNFDAIIIDDHYFGDTTNGPGAAPANSPIGDAKVSTLWATGDNSVQWLPKTGILNYAMIDEQAMDSDTTYNRTLTVSAEDIFAFETLPAGVTNVHAIQLTGAYRKDDALVRTISQRLEISAIKYPATINHNVPDGEYTYFVDLWVLNPNTLLNWTILDVNGLAAGYKLIA